MVALSFIDWIVIILFFILIAYVGKWASSKVKSEEDYLIGSKSLGKLPTALSTAATDFGGSSLIGAAGLAYTAGIAGAWWNWSAVPAWIILGLTLAKGFRKLGLTTVPEFLERRYSVKTRVVAALLYLGGQTVSITAQTVVAALAITTLTGIPQHYTYIIATVLFVTYTAAGGLVAVVWTDVIEYFVLMFGVIIMMPLAISKAGGMSHIMQTVPASFWDLGAMGTMEPAAWIALCFFAYSTNQHVVQRLFASKDESTARFAYIFTGVNFIFYGLIVAVLGIAASVIAPNLSDPDMAVPVLIQQVLPVGIRGLLLASILAATMSTSSSKLNSCATIFHVDIYKRLIRKDISEKEGIFVARVTTVVIALISLLFSKILTGVVSIIVLSSLIYSAGVFFPLILGMRNKKVNAYGATSAIILGGGFAVLSKFYLYKHVGGFFGGLHPMFAGSIASLLLLLIVSKLTPAPSPDKYAFIESLNEEELTKKF
ncbi:sodium:solute symporter family protein [Wukongibacter baidiensis]|uniref:sodium:solute symporter family protein n=1 Tax=Wukongibacter baidiensis TaxID=1723361 RepID=UPI003D7FC1EE